MSIVLHPMSGREQRPIATQLRSTRQRPWGWAPRKSLRAASCPKLMYRRAMRIRHLCLLALAACATPKAELVGSGIGAIAVRGRTAPAAAGGVRVERGTYEVEMTFEVPFSQVVEYTLACPGATRHGVVGIPLVSYQAAIAVRAQLGDLRVDARVLADVSSGAGTLGAHAQIATD